MLLRCKTWIHAVISPILSCSNAECNNGTSTIPTYMCTVQLHCTPNVYIFKSRKCVLVLSKWFMFFAGWQCKQCRFQYQIVQFVYDANIWAMVKTAVNVLNEIKMAKCTRRTKKSTISRKIYFIYCWLQWLNWWLQFYRTKRWAEWFGLAAFISLHSNSINN